jgi:hypothetical protein
VDIPKGSARFGAFARFSQIIADFEHLNRRGRYVEEGGTRAFRRGRDRGKPYFQNLHNYLLHYARDAYEEFEGEKTAELAIVRSRSSNSHSTGRPPNAIEMLDTGIDRELRVFGHDFQNRWRIHIRASEHCRDSLERHRAGTYLRVVKRVERRVCSIHKQQMIAEL